MRKLTSPHQDMAKNSRKKYVSVYRRSGKYAAIISDPIRKKRVWLGTFSTAQEASKVYAAKKEEFEKELEAKQGFQWVVREESKPAESSSVLDVHISGSSPGGCGLNPEKVAEDDLYVQSNEGFVKKECLAVSIDQSSSENPSSVVETDAFDSSNNGGRKNCIADGEDDAEESEPVQNNEGCVTEQVLVDFLGQSSSLMVKIGTLNSCKEKFETSYTNFMVIEEDGVECNEEFVKQIGEECVGYYEGSMKKETIPVADVQEDYGPSSFCIEPSDMDSEESYTSRFTEKVVQNTEGLEKFQFLKEPDDEGNSFGLEFTSPIIDNHGFLLGEWSWIDDLSICGVDA